MSDSERFHSRWPAKSQDPIPIALAAGLINKRDAELIKAYIYERISADGMTKIHALQATRLFCNSRRWCGPYAEVTITDLYKIVEGVKTGLSKRGLPFAEKTQREYITKQKAFFLWLVESGIVDIPEKKIQAVKSPAITEGITNSADLLTSEEVLEILNACESSRDRALFTVLYEGGFRIGEVGTMRWGALKFDSAGIVVNTAYKTKKPRYIRLIMCKTALAAWKTDYPGDPSGDSFVFLSNRGKMLQYHAIRKCLDRILIKTSIKKRVNLHLFRHSRVTHLMREGVSESVIKMMMWGSVNARSFSNYAHLAGTDIDREMMKLYGIEAEFADKKEKSLTPVICSRCQEICSPTNRYCPSCGMALGEEAIDCDERLRAWLMDNKAYLSAYLNKMQ